MLDLTYLVIWDDDMSQIHAEPGEIHRVDAAVEEFHSTGGHNNKLIHIAMADGGEYSILASAITSWKISSPATRRRELELRKALKDEHEAMLIEVGLDEKSWED